MLYIGTKPVNLTNKSEDYEFSKEVKEFDSLISDLKQRHGEVILFKTIYGPQKDKITGSVRDPKPMTVPFRAYESTPDGRVSWTYSPEPIGVKDGVLVQTEKYHLVKFGCISLNINEDADFIFLLTKTDKFKSGQIYIHDEEEIEEQTAEKRAREARLTEAIYSGSSKLNDITFLRQVARKWGVGNVDNKRMSSLKNALYSQVSQAEGQRKRNRTSEGLQSFLMDLDDQARLVIGEDIQLAIDKDLLTFSRETNEWLLRVDKDKSLYVITKVPNEETFNSRDVLARYLQSNPDDAKKLSMVVSGKAAVEHGKVVESTNPVKEDDDPLSFDNIRKEDNFEVLKRAYKEYGLGNPVGPGKNKAFIKDALLKYIEEQAVTAN